MNPTSTILLLGLYSVICLLFLSRIIRVLMKRYDKVTNDEILDILHSPFIPKVSLILTNDAVPSVERVFSLMALQYGSYELILVLDRSNLLISELKKEFLLKAELKKPAVIPVRGDYKVFRSDRPGFRKLVVVEKVSGSIGDALNTGLNCSNGQYVCLLTKPAFLYRDSIVKLLKPFLERFGELTASSAAVRVRPVDDARSTGALRNIRNFVLHGAGGNSVLAIEAFCAGTGMIGRKDILLAGGFPGNSNDPVRQLLYVLASTRIDKNKRPLMEYVPEVLVQTESTHGQAYGILDQIRCYFSLLKRSFTIRRTVLMIPLVFPGISYFLLLLAMILLMIVGPGTGSISMLGSVSYFVAGYTFLVASSLLALFIEIRFSVLKYSGREIRKLVSASFVLPFKFHFPGKT